MMTRLAAAAAFGLLVLQSMAAASAADIDFSLTTSQEVEIRCNGPWARISPCAHLQASGAAQNFYTADDNFLDPYGVWHCQVHKKVRREFCSVAELGFVQFCVLTPKVDLKWDGSSLTVNQTPRCRLARAGSVLGQNGEADDSPAQDLDTYTFEGKPGEQVEIALDRDGSSGSAGDTATLRVRSAGGAVLGKRTGSVPLSLEVTLTGLVEVAVSIQPGGGEPLRGSYVLQVIPKSGDIGERKLRPTRNVEG
ncbi:MAG: hypothetical protein AB7I59_00150 [Geminicoccaceae bacterium]